jgi:hypothetical protein
MSFKRRWCPSLRLQLPSASLIATPLASVTSLSIAAASSSRSRRAHVIRELFQVLCDGGQELVVDGQRLSLWTA